MQTKQLSCLLRFRTFQLLTFPNTYLSERRNTSQITFKNAVEKMKALGESLDIESKLKLHGLYSQVMFGDVTNKQPGIFQFMELAKYNAWKACAGLSKEQAERNYQELAISLMEKAIMQTVPKNLSDIGNISGLKLSLQNHVLRITFDRPKKYNALTLQMYRGLISALKYANTCDDIMATALSGSGPYYSSGNDIENLSAVNTTDNSSSFLSSAAALFEQFIKAFINHEKPLLIFVNGPAVGIAVTTLPLANYVMASDKATFHTPFTALGISPEGCSTYTFPLLMGLSKASEVLLFGRKLNAYEAMERNLVNQVVSDQEFESEMNKTLQNVSKLPKEALKLNRLLLISNYRRILEEVNQKETVLLKQRWLSDECRKAAEKFMRR